MHLTSVIRLLKFIHRVGFHETCIERRDIQQNLIFHSASYFWYNLIFIALVLSYNIM